MSYSAKTFNVMIASPGDVGAERAIVRDVVYEWNAVHSESRKIVLLPIGWESHSSPEMGASPQSIINGQILSRCDLMIGIFWTRVGTPTDEFASGTVEEVEKHILSEKPAMLYFSSQPVALETVDMDQIGRLKKFKDSCKSRGLYEGYDSLSDFRTKLYRHLQIKLNDHPLFGEARDIVENAIEEPAEFAPQLSKSAGILLKEASKDNQGSIVFVRYLNGTNLQTNGKVFVDSESPREVAAWESAIRELVSANLIIARGEKGEIFNLTELGYKTADLVEG